MTVVCLTYHSAIDSSRHRPLSACSWSNRTLWYRSLLIQKLRLCLSLIELSRTRHYRWLMRLMLLLDAFKTLKLGCLMLHRHTQFLVHRVFLHLRETCNSPKSSNLSFMVNFLDFFVNECNVIRAIKSK